MGNWLTEGEEIKQKKPQHTYIYIYISHIDKGNSVVMARENGVAVGGGGQRGDKRNGNRLDFGRWVHDAVYR